MSSRGGVIPSHYEIGTQVSTNFLNDRTFVCFAVVPDRKGSEKFVRRNCVLVITDTAVVELTPFPHLIDSATVSEVHELEGLEKLKFKKGQQGGSVFMQWKSSKVSTFLMHDPMVCVELVKTKMNKLGLKGQSLRSAMFLENAMSCLENCKSIERQFALAPSLKLVDEMMDLLRLSAEKFAEANEDKGYMHVISYIQSFLQRADVIKILDSCVQRKQQRKPQVQEKEDKGGEQHERLHQSQQNQLGASLQAQQAATLPAAAAGSHNVFNIDCDSAAAEEDGTPSHGSRNKNTNNTIDTTTTTAAADDINNNNNNNSSSIGSTVDSNVVPINSEISQANITNAQSSAEWSALVDDMDSDLMDLLNSFGDIAAAADNATEETAKKTGVESGALGAANCSSAASEDISAFDMKEFEDFFS